MSNDPEYPFTVLIPGGELAALRREVRVLRTLNATIQAENTQLRAQLDTLIAAADLPDDYAQLRAKVHRLAVQLEAADADAEAERALITRAFQEVFGAEIVALRAQVQQLRALLEQSKLPHTEDCLTMYNPAYPCSCAARRHNARIDAALQETPYDQ